MNHYFLRRNRTQQLRETQTINTTNMTTQSVDVFNALKIPDAIKDLPKYNGNPRLLYDFISNVEEILSIVQQTNNMPQNKIYLRAIRNKIEGDANEVLNMYGTALNWSEIKTNLILHYSDKRTETSLIRDLHKLQQNSKTVEKFYSEIIELQSTLVNNVKIHESDQNIISSKTDLFSEMCLSAFLSGLVEPLGSNIRASKPRTLAEAFNYCIKEQNISNSRYTPYSKPKMTYYNQNSSSSQNGLFNNNRKNFSQTPRNLHEPNYNHKNQNPFKNNNPRYSFKRNFSGNQNFRSNVANQESNNVNMFKSATPSDYQQAFPNHQNANYNKSNELTNIEETQNFQLFASTNQQAT